MAAASAEKGCSPGRLGAFTFIRSRGSLRKQLKRQHSRCEGETSSSTSGTIGRWLRELRSSPRDARQTQPSTPTPPPPQTTTTKTTPAVDSERIDRNNPVYHSEGKGLRKRKDRDRRRHSFNEPQGDQQAPRQTTSWFTDGRPLSERRSMARDAPSSGSRHLMTSLGPAAGRATTATHLRNHHLAKPQEPQPQMPSIYSYLPREREDSSPPPTPPVRDASSLKALRYGPGHEKFPSWPVSASLRPTSGGSHRSKSWTEQTSYPKEPSQPYTRPFMKRSNPHFTQQLMTVMERCEKIPVETFETSLAEDSCPGGQYQLPRLDRDGKLLGDSEYSAPSPPERDKPHSPLTQAELDQYTRNYQLEDYMRVSQEAGPQVQVSLKSGQPSPTSAAASLTQADLEEYARVYEDSLRGSSQHVHQASYAHSEGYHSYVSSSDSTTTTPFLDRLRRDSEVGPCTVGASAGPQTGPRQHWACSSAASSGIGAEAECEESSSCGAGRESGSESASSSETLKWHGSISDLSVASSTNAAPLSSAASRQLIVHSARVQTPQKHHSESVLYLGGQLQGPGWQTRVHSNNQQNNKLRLFPVNTYTVEPHHTSRTLPLSVSQTKLSVADRISELERQQQPQQQTRYTYLDPEKKHRVSDPTLKAIQKKALLSFYERHQHGSSWRSEPHLASAQPQIMYSTPCQGQPPQPPPRPRASTGSMTPNRRGSWRELASTREINSLEMNNLKDSPRHQYSSSCGSLATEALGPLIVGPSISIDDWVPERPPKKPHLRAPASVRGPSPDLPPPPSPTPLDELPPSDEPLPPPPPEVASPWRQDASKNHTHKLLVNGKLAVEDSFRPPPRRPRCSGGGLVEGKLRPLGLSLPPSVETSAIIRSTSKASYLASRREQRERGLPNFEGSYKQTVSPHGLSTLPSTPPTATVTRSQTIGPSPGLHKFASSPAISIPLNHSPPLPLNSYNNNNINNVNHKNPSPTNNVNNHKNPSPTNNVNNHKNPSPTNNVINHKNPSPTHNVINHKNPSPTRNVINHKNPSPTHNVINHKNPSPTCTSINIIVPEKSSSPIPLKSCLPAAQIQPKETIDKKEKSPEPEERCLLQSSPRLVDSASHSPTPSSSSASSTSASSSTSTCSPPPSGAASPVRVDSLRLVQRSEIVLRVAPPTSDAVTQTDCVDPPSSPSSPPMTPPPVTATTPTTPATQTSATSASPTDFISSSLARQKLEEELECERLSKDLASQLSPSDKLQGLLVQGPDHKRPSDYVAGLFRLEIAPRTGRLTARTSNTSPNSTSDSPPPPSGGVMSNGVNGSAAAAATQTEESTTPPSPPSIKEETTLPSNSAYFTTSESKARFLARYSRDIQTPLESTNDLNQKKEELMSRLDRKLAVLRGEHLVVTEESRVNEELGATVAAHVTRAARPHESAKYRLHVEEVGKITSLLLGLSGRLARAENALCGLPSDHADRPILASKRDKLLEQLEEAKKLKENIDRRSVSVANILNKYFSPEEYADYDHFIHMKAKLIMDSREIADKIKLGEEQLSALRETLSK